VTKQEPDTYAHKTMAELRRLGADRDQIRQIMTEVFAQAGNAPDRDLSAVFGSAEQFAADALAGRRPVRADYLRRLRTELHALGVPSGRIGEVLAEVDEHVSDTGERPVAAFGPPDQYAARIAEETGAKPQPRPGAARSVLTGALTTAGTLLAVEGVVGLVRDHSAPVTVAVLLTALLVPVLGYTFASLVRPSGAAGCALAFGTLAAKLLVQAGVLVWFRQPVVASLPAWAAVGAGLAAVLALIVVSRPNRSNPLFTAVVDPRPGATRGDSVVWDTDERAGDLPRGIAWGTTAICLAEVAALTVVVLLLR
jgi:hypothetical protein